MPDLREAVEKLKAEYESELDNANYMAGQLMEKCGSTHNVTISMKTNAIMFQTFIASLDRILLETTDG